MSQSISGWTFYLAFPRLSSTLQPQAMTLDNAFKQFPLHLIGVLRGMLLVLLTQPEGVLFIIVGVLAGFAFHSAWAGALLAFTLYTIFYVITQYVSLWASKSDRDAALKVRDHG